MTESGINRPYIIEEMSGEHFIAEHYFIYVSKGFMTVYDGSEWLELKAGECCLARKNRLARYYKRLDNNELNKTLVALDEVFLKQFQERYPIPQTRPTVPNTFVRIHQIEALPVYIQSLQPYYQQGVIDAAFANVKREELLIILLRAQPELASILFDYGIPQKINLEEFMSRNYMFNVDNERFAFLTGRSLSAFKRDFKQVFKETPNRWLVQKRLQEARFRIEQQGKRPSEIYLELGFETLAHFSFAFKRQFGMAPTALTPSVKKGHQVP